MKEKYIDLMEKALSAYSDKHIERYFNDVRENGLTEHGFPRLTSNIGILISHNRRRDLLSAFCKMMDLCCATVPKVKAANDFSVRELVCCILEIEKSGALPEEDTDRWRQLLSNIKPENCYDKFAVSPTDTVRNWALFTAVSEYFRQSAGLCNSEDFIELQLCQQLQWFDENGMYRDNAKEDFHNPMVYDLVPRVLLSLLLDAGYCGKYREIADGILKKAGMLTLGMQSVSGEIAFGGRSNQFLHNEALLAVIFEYEAKRYAREGKIDLASRFNAASKKAISALDGWISKKSIYHVKNRFPTETMYGCEKYAYFDKYMITVASFIYAAYLICDDSLTFEDVKEESPAAVLTSDRFHKLFLKGGGYGLEFDLNADALYDANGLGRVHKEDAPSAICLSCPCPKKPKYRVDISDPIAFSICSSAIVDDRFLLGADPSSKYELVCYGADADTAYATLTCLLENGKSTSEHYTVGKDGVIITVKGEGKIGLTLPAFCFDGETEPKISTAADSLTVSYLGYTCRYTTSGRVKDIDRIAANRNGHYKCFVATAENEINVRIEIFKE